MPRRIWWDDDPRFPEHIGSNEVSPVTVATAIHRMTVDEYVRIVRDLGWESTELVEGVVYDVTPELSRHAGNAAAVFRQVDVAFADDLTLFSGSVRLGSFSLVEPALWSSPTSTSSTAPPRSILTTPSPQAR